MTTKQKNTVIYTTATIILSVPLIAMQFTEEVRWSPADFLIAGILLFSAAFAVSTIINTMKLPGKRIIYVAAVLIVLILIWAEMAVGIFGSPIAGS